MSGHNVCLVCSSHEESHPFFETVSKTQRDACTQYADRFFNKMNAYAYKCEDRPREHRAYLPVVAEATERRHTQEKTITQKRGKQEHERPEDD
jgi:hypothetical protein